MRDLIERMGLAALRQLDPERAHTLAITALKAGIAPLPSPLRRPRLETKLADLKLPNPLGLAAGFDKNAEVIRPLMAAGFGFIEIGAVTPRPQPGNPKPRLFRLTKDRAVINRFGFNNEGMEFVAERLEQRPKGGVLGINLGANKDSEDRAADYGKVLTRCGDHVDFATINVSSPNTEQLRDLQGKDALRAVLTVASNANAALTNPVPLFLKIAPDLALSDLDDIVSVSEEAGLAGIIATNTTLSRENVIDRQRTESGGLSGAPLFRRSTEVLRALNARTALPLIGVGGISTAEDAIAKLEAGATALQLYSALVYEGMRLVPRILKGIDAHLAAKAG